MSFPQFAQEAQKYGITPEQYAAILQQTVQPAGYGMPTTYGAQGQQQQPNVPQQQNIQTLQLLKNAGLTPVQQAQQQGASPSVQGTAAPGGSYLSLTGGAGGTGTAASAAGTAAGGGTTQTGATMANGTGQPQIQAGQSMNLIMPGGGALSPAQTQQVMRLYSAYEGGDAQSGQALAKWAQGMGLGTAQLNTAVSNLRQGTGPNAAPTPTQQPESVALKQMAQIDPASEALRGGLAGSYLTPLAQAAAPTAGQFQGLLKTYGQVDPTGAAARTQLGSDLAAQERLGTQLDPATQRQLEQQTRIAQGARGNVYGTPQLVEEAMTTGQAGMALQQQRQQALQGYLTSGASTGDLAMNLYNQQQANLRASQQAALGYLGSGQTPYQAGASYLNTAEQRAAAAAQGGAAYNPQGPSGYYTGQGASSFPQYGLDTSQTAANWYNLMNAYNQPQGGASGQNKAGSAAAGALGGAASGAMTGMAAGPYGALIGGAVGAVGGAAKGYFS